MPPVKQGKDPHENAIGLSLRDHFELVDWAGRTIREDKRVAIPSAVPPMLQRLGLDTQHYLVHLLGHAETEKPAMLGHIDQIREAARLLGCALSRRLVNRSSSFDMHKPHTRH